MRAGLLLIIFLFTQNSQAAFGNYNSILLGDQAAGMGGAYTALSQDSAALAFYNPAGLGDLDQASVSASVTVYKKFDTVFGRSEDIITAGLRSSQGFFQSIPSSSASIINFEKFNVALTILNPYHSSYNGEVYSDRNTTLLLNHLDESLWVGGGLGLEISEGEYLGLSLFYTARNFRQISSDRNMTDSGDLTIHTVEKQFTYNSIVPILGYQKVFSPKWRFGVSVQFPSMKVGGKGSYHSSLIASREREETIIDTVGLAAHSPIPGAVRMGIAYRPQKLWLFSMDISHHGSMSYYDMGKNQTSTMVEQEAVTDLAIGAEWVPLSWLKFRSGIYTNYSAHPTPNENLNVDQPASIDKFGFSANVSFAKNDNIHYTFGGYYNGGVGTSLYRINQRHTEVKTSDQTFTMLIATSYYF